MKKRKNVTLFSTNIYMRINNYKKWALIIGLCLFILAILIGYISKKSRYLIVNSTDAPYETGVNSYYIYDIDTTKLHFQCPYYKNGNLKIKIKCNDFSFLEGCSPIIIKMNAQKGNGKKYKEIQYELKYKNNLILIPGKELEATEYILRIGYYKYEEIFNGNYDFHSIAYKLVKDNDLYTVKDYPDDNPKVMNGKKIIHSITEKNVVVLNYIYQYDIDSFFRGFRDNNGHLIDNDYVIIELKNGSRYEGGIRNGFFEGKGTFKDNLLHKVYEDRTFIKGNMVSNTEVDNRTYIKTIERPLLSEEYPKNGCYKTEDVFIDSIHVQRTDYLYGRNELNEIVYRKHIITFDKDGNVKSDNIIAIKEN